MTLCCALYDAFLAYIHAENLEPIAGQCDITKCIAKDYIFINNFIDNTNIDAVFLSENPEHSAISFNVDHDDQQIANLLLFAYIGKHFTANREETHPIFKYNFATNVLRAVQPHCAFERRVYLTMIILTVVVLVFVILGRHIPTSWKVWELHKHKQEQKSSKTRTQTATHEKVEITGSGSSIHGTGSKPLDFGTSGLRQR